MKITLLALSLCFPAGWLSAEQIKPPESDAEYRKAAASAVAMPQYVDGKPVAAPVSTAPAAAVKPAASSPAAAPEKKAPVKAVSTVKKAGPAAVPAPPAREKEAASILPVVEEPHTGAGSGVVKRHTVSSGDTLWDLSGKYYNDPYKWGKIYNANLGTVANPDRIYPKEELVIPGITEEVKPAASKAAVIEEAETVKEAEMSSADIAQPAAPAPEAAVKREPATRAEPPADFSRNALSEEMPEDQSEWSDNVKVVPDDWLEDGVITARLAGRGGSMEDSLSVEGAPLEITMSGPGIVKAGDQLAIYLKADDVHDRSGKRLGRGLQRVGLAEVVDVQDLAVTARVMDATTAISKGYIVKKK